MDGILQKIAYVGLLTLKSYSVRIYFLTETS